jgi:immune inhibitor A
MHSKTWKLLAPFVLGILLVGLALTAMFTNRQLGNELVVSADGPEGVLSPQRLAYYDNLLQKSMREAPYLIAPKIEVVYREVQVALGRNASPAEVQAAVDQYYQQFHATNMKVSRPNPLARLGHMKQAELARARDEAFQLTGQPEILTVMMDFTEVETYTTADPVAYYGNCLTDTTVFTPGFELVIDGPSFNEIEQPADNWTPWLDPATSYTGGFTEEYFDLLMYSTTGYTQIMRPELTNPWTGGNGFDFSGVSFKNWYLENSRGVYDPVGEVIRVQIPEAVSFFGAAQCNGVIQDDSYHGRPDYTVAISAAQTINAQIPDFDWTAWDKEDVFDYDNDGDFFEPDGYVDHFFLIEAGEAQGGKYGEFLIWPHSWDVRIGTPNGPAVNQLGGFQVSSNGPLGGVWILNYTVSDEVGGLGVLVHEYGHDIGLPDNYAIAGTQGANTGFWDQMSSGTFGGGLSGMQPTHMTIWDKAEPYLGWNNPVEVDFETVAEGEAGDVELTVGQQSIPPAGTQDGLRIKLPDKVTEASVEPFDNMMWYSDQGDDRNESIGREFTPPAGQDVTIAAKLAYLIELDWDYLYWEYSTDDGSSWTQLDVFSGTTEITTDTDPNGNNTSGNGITGASDWIDATATITAAAHGGGNTWFRFRYFTDSAVQEEGIYLDNILISAGSTTLVSDDAESGDNWTHFSEGLNTDHPWFIFDGQLLTEHSYLVEWRNSGEGSGFNNVPEQQAFATAGFDIGLNRMYWVDELDQNGNIAHVDPFFVHTPGMLIWYADGSYSDNSVGNYIFNDP